MGYTLILKDNAFLLPYVLKTNIWGFRFETQGAFYCRNFLETVINNSDELPHGGTYDG